MISPGRCARLRGRGWRIIVSDLHGEDFYARPELGSRFVLVIGNEARGISDAVKADGRHAPEAADARGRGIAERRRRRRHYDVRADAPARNEIKPRRSIR